MDTDPQAAEGALEPERTELEEAPGSARTAPEPLTVGNGSQVVAVTINLNLPVFGSVVYATRRAIPPAVGGRVFDVVRRVVGTVRSEGYRDEPPAEGEETEPAPPMSEHPLD